MKITAAVLSEANTEFALCDLELADPRDDELIVRIFSVGICHTDIGVQSTVPLPVVLGHEGTGIVERRGDAVSKFSVGDRVSLTFGSCGQCRNCDENLPSHCYDLVNQNFVCESPHGGTILKDSNGTKVHGAFFSQSSFATHALVNMRSAVKLPLDADHKYLGPLGCGIQTGAGAIVNTLGAESGSSVVCIGLGAVGLSAVMMAKLVGCETIIGIDVIGDRLSLAQELGATHVFNSADQSMDEITAQIVRLTKGGADYSFETAGVAATFHASLACLRIGGHAALAAIPNWENGFHFNANDLMFGRSITGVLEGASVPDVFIPQLYDYFEQGRFPIDRLMSFYPFAEINQAMDDLKHGRVIKPVILMD